MKHRILKGIALVTLLLGTGATLTACGGQGAQENRAKAELMQFSNGNGKSMIAQNKFNKNNNTDEVTFEPSTVKKLNLMNTINNDMHNPQHNKKLVAQGKATRAKYKVPLKENAMQMSSFRSALKKAVTDSKDKNLKLKIMNPTSTYPDKLVEQAQLQPNHKFAVQEMKQYQKQQMKKAKQAQQKEKQQIMNRLTNKQNGMRKQVQQKMRKKHVPYKQQKIVMGKLNKRLAQQRTKVSQNVDKQMQKAQQKASKK